MTLKSVKRKERERGEERERRGRKRNIGLLKYAKLELVCITTPITKLKKFPQYIKAKYAEHGVIRDSING